MHSANTHEWFNRRSPCAIGWFDQTSNFGCECGGASEVYGRSIQSVAVLQYLFSIGRAVYPFKCGLYKNFWSFNSIGFLNAKEAQSSFTPSLFILFLQGVQKGKDTAIGGFAFFNTRLSFSNNVCKLSFLRSFHRSFYGK